MKINKMKLFLCLLVLLAIVGIIIFLICINPKETKKKEVEVKYEKINMITNFRLGVSSFDSINPIISQNKDILQIDSLIFEPLLTITKNYKIENCLAEEWSKVDEKSYVIKLKQNVKWQDGTDLTTQDVKFTIQAIKKNERSIYSKNVKQIQKAEIIDDHTIRLELKKDTPFFEYQLIFPILSKKQYEKQDMAKSKEIPIGTGMYKITRLDKQIIELEKNENWHEIESKNPNIKNITIEIFETMGEVYNSFRLGNIDIINTNSTNYEEYIGSLGYQKKEYQGREYDYLAFNCENEVLKNVEVRKAIEKAINKEKIISTILENKAYVASFPLDYGNYIMEGIELEKNSNDEEASKILKDSGWKYEYEIWSKEIGGQTRTLNFDLVVNKENKKRVNVAKEIENQLESIGIKIKIRELSEANYQKILENHSYECILTGVYNGYSPELNSFLGEGNLANYKNEEINAILKETQNMTSENLLKEKYQKIINIYQKEVPYIGLYRNQVTVAYGQSVRGDITPNNYSVFYKFDKWYRQ